MTSHKNWTHSWWIWSIVFPHFHSSSFKINSFNHHWR